MVAEEAGRIPVFVTLSVLDARDGDQPFGRTREALLRWADDAGLFAEPLRKVDERALVVAGQETRVLLAVGEPAGMGELREIALAHVGLPGYHLIVLAVYSPASDDERTRAFRLVRGIELR